MPSAWPEQFRSRAKQACRLTRGETLDVPGIYELARGQRDRHLVRRTDLETPLLGPPETAPSG